MATAEQKDRIQLLKTFPTEIWLQIFNHVDKETDYKKICQASMGLYTLFEPLRPKILFPSAAEVLVKRSQQLKNNWFGEFRLLSKSWKETVDDILQNSEICHGSNPLEKYIRIPFQVDVIKYPAVVFKCACDLHNFTVDFDDTDTNPFITHSAIFVVTLSGHNLYYFYGHLLNMLLQFGHHFYYCELVLALTDWREQENVFKMMGPILSLMPNLKRFQFNNQTHAGIAFLEIDNLMRRYPILTMDNLEYFNQSGMPVAMVRSLIQSNPQITTVNTKSYQTRKHFRVYLKKIPHLEAFAVELHTFDDFVCFRKSAAMCRLKKLNIQMPLVKVCWESVFSMLNLHFAETLEELCILLPNSDVVKIDENGVLQLPKLKELTISTKNIGGLDFLLPLTNNLEKFSLLVQNFGFPAGYQERHRIKVFHINGWIYNTNIWNVMAKLEVLDVTFAGRHENFYTRKSWSKFRAKRMS